MACTRCQKNVVHLITISCHFKSIFYSFRVHFCTYTSKRILLHSRVLFHSLHTCGETVLTYKKILKYTSPQNANLADGWVSDQISVEWKGRTNKKETQMVGSACRKFAESALGSLLKGDFSLRFLQLTIKISQITKSQ